MQSDHYKSAKKQGLLELLKQMQGLMAKGHADKPMGGGDVKSAVAEAEHEAGLGHGHDDEHAEGEPMDAEDLADGGSDEAAEGEENDPHAEPDFKQHVRDFLSGKQKPKQKKRALVVREMDISVGRSPKGMPGKLPFGKKRA